MSERSRDNKKNKSGIAKIVGTITFKVVMLVLITIGIAFLAGKAYSFGYNLFSDNAVDKGAGKNIVVNISEDMSNGEVAELLARKGVITDSSSFKALLMVFTNSSYGVIPGEYTINTSQSMREIIDTISGKIETEQTTAEHLGLYD